MLPPAARRRQEILEAAALWETTGCRWGPKSPVTVLAMPDYSRDVSGESAAAFAADATAARIMGFAPERVPYLVGASRFLQGLKTGAVKHWGEDPERFATRFDCLPKFRAMWREDRR